MKLGLDIGGSTIRGTVEDNYGITNEYIFHFEANPSSSRRSFINLKNAIESIGIKKYELIACGMAGGFQPSFVNAVKEILLKFADKVYVFPDIIVVHFAHFESDDGIVSIAGTGSSSYGKHGHREFVYGGLGYALSDVGSGFFIGKEFLKNALQELQLGINSERIELVKDYFKELNPHSIIEKIYADNPAKTIADFSKFLISTLPNAYEIEFSAELFAQEVIDLAKALEFKDKLPIGISGGVFEHSEYFKQVFFNSLSKEFEIIKIERKYLNTIASLRKAEYEERHSS